MIILNKGDFILIIDDYIKEIKLKLDEKRFEHSMAVADSAKALAVKYGADPEKAYIAGIMHDVMKQAKRKEHFALFDKYNIEISPVERATKKLWHAMSGALYAEKNAGITDCEILSAIRYHTTGRANMTLMEKILFIADFISLDRDYPEVERMREKAKISLELAMLEGVQFTILELVEKNNAIHRDTICLYNELILENFGGKDFE